MSDVFISYAREDRAAAERLAEALERAKWSVWWDRELLGGDDFRDQIEARLRTARCAIVLWSPHSVGSRFVRAEANLAADSGKLVPLTLVEDLQLPLPFGEAHTLPFWDWDGSDSHVRFRPLLDALASRSGIAAGSGPGAARAAQDEAPAASPKREPIRRAVLVGVDGYATPADFPPLTVAHASIRCLAQVLEEAEGGGFEVTSLFDPTDEQLQTVLLTFFRAPDLGPEDVLLLYFAGHAVIGEENDLYLCPQNASAPLLDATAVSLVWLAGRAINKCPAENLLIVFDCQYRSAPGRGVDCDVGSVLHANLGQGKAKFLLSSSTVLDAPVLQGTGPSLLADRMARGIAFWEAAEGDDVLTAEELCRYVCEQLEKADLQARPRYWGFNTTAGQGEIARRKVEAVTQIVPKQDQGAFFAAVRSKLEQGRIAPFVGDGIYGTGALSSFRLVREMTRAAGLEAGMKMDERYPLATAAEYLQEVLRGREDFLAQFQAIIEAQRQESRPSAVHDLVRGLHEPWVAISASYDAQLEARLDEEGLPFVVVAHVLASPDREDDGKMVIAVRGKEPSTRICAADGWTLSELGEASARVIYKIVGSTWLNGLLDPELGIDTVVVTESDHLRFLSRLENGQTGFPPALARPLQNRSLLFLGYNLDVWHYRLVGHIFGSGGLVQSKNRFAVRTATSPLEERFWTRLVATEDRLRSDPESFVRALRNTEGGQ